MLKTISRVVLGLFWLISLSVAAQPVASVSNGVPAESFAGEQFCYTLGFNNTGTAPGFGPYFRLSLPPGISFDSASFLGTGVAVTTVGTFPAAPGNQLTDPRTGTAVTGPPGGTLVILVLPLGSVVVGGPALNTQVCLTIDTAAVVGTPLDITAQPVFEFGDTATGANGPIIGAASTNAVTPTVVTLAKSQGETEGERTPGPFFEFSYTLTVDVANGKSVFDLDLIDTLPPELQFVRVDSITGGVNCNAVATPSTVTPGGVLRVQCDRVDGTTASGDLTIVYTVYIIDILDETNCANLPIMNTATLDVEHPDNNVLPQLSDDDTITAKHLAIQKGAAPGAARPGDTITFTLNWQVSEFATADSLVITDTLSDGYTFGAHLSMTVGGLPFVITPTVTANPDGTTTLVWDVGAVTGNLPPTTTGVITYNATIDQSFTPAPDPILASDSLSNTVTAAYSLTAGAAGCADGSGASVGIIPVDISKSIVNLQPQYVPGETVTFRLRLEIPSGDTEGVVFEDFFPLPVFDVTSLNLTFGTDIRLGPGDTLGFTPTSITVDAAENSLRIEWPDVDTTTSEVIEVDVDIVVEDDPFADNLFLSNLLQAFTVNNDPLTASALTLVQILVRAPSLVIAKGVSASDNPTADATISPSPATLPVDGDIADSDAGDTITYTITVENIGGAAAFNVRVDDPAVAALTGATIVSVVDGAGTPIPFRDPADVPAPAPPGLPIPTDLSAGILLDPPLAPNDGNPAGGGAPYGPDTAIITVRYTLAGTVEPNEQIDNTASVAWASQSGAVVFPSVSDDASATIASPAIDKTVTAIAPSYTGNLTQAHIGEVVTYQVVITLPEGVSSNVSFTDLLDNGLAFTDVVSITPSSGDVTTDAAGGFPGVLAGAAFSPSGGGAHQLDRFLTLDFGNVTNANTNNAVAETITIVYRARVLNWTNNDRGDNRNNRARWTWDNPNGGGTTFVQDNAPNVQIVEPELQIVKSLSSPVADAGDTLTVTLDISHTGASNADAFDVTLEDILPTGFTFAGGFAIAGLAPTTAPAHAGGTVTAGWTSLPEGATAQITFQVTVDATVEPTEQVTNTAEIQWESLADTDQPALPSPPSNTLGVERTGDPADPGGAANDYQDQASDSVDVPDAAISKSVDSITPGGSSPNVTAGDTVTYRLTVTLPEGTTSGLTLSDALPPGFSFQSAMLDTTGFNGSVSLGSAMASGMVATGQTVAIAFGATTTVTGDNNPANNSFAVLVTALVEGGEAINDGLPTVQTKSNGVTLDYTGNGGTIQDSVDVSFAEPDLQITKTMSPDSNLEAGTTVTITLTVTNTGTGVAHDITVTDVLNDDGSLFDTTAGNVVEVTTAAGFTFGYSEPTVTYSGGATTLAPSAMVQFQFTAVVRADVLTGSSFSNTAAVNGDSQTGAVTAERMTGDTGADTATTSAATQGKTLIASSESWTSDTAPIEAAIGEVLTFQVIIDLPEGLTQADPTTPILVDTLPAGMQYLFGTAMIRAVTDSTVTGANLPVGLSPIPTADATITPTVNGQDLEFDLGDIQNNDSDANVEQLILTYDVLVLNTTDNNRADSKSNSAAFTYLNRAGLPQTQTENVSLSVAEPNLGVSKSANPTTVVGGTTVTFTVVLTNQAGTNVTRAWEPLIADTLPSRYNSLMLTSATLSRGAVDISGCVTILGNTITLDTDDACLAAAERYLAAGETITLIYTADIDPSIQFEEQVVNTATGEATSLPGSNGTFAATPGAPDSDTGERTGSGALNTSGQSVNDLTAMDSATVTADRPTLTKTGGANLQIGQTTTFTITVSAPVGTTDNFTITDNLPAGLRYIGTATITPPAMNFTSSLTPTAPVADTDPLVFDFGTITNSAGMAQDIVITYEVQVQNVLANQNTTNLVNDAQLSYLNIGAPIGDTATITVIEANLNIVKTVTAGATGSDAGDTISYQVQVSNTAASGTAYRVDLRDVLPEDLLGGAGAGGTAPFFLNIMVTNPGGAAVLNSDGVTALAAGDATFATTTLTDDTLTWPLFDLPPGATLTITYDAVVANGASAGATLQNDVTASYHSLADGDAAGRDGSTANSDDDNDADLNNYNESDNASITLDASVSIQKTLTASQPDSNFAIGDEVLFDLRVDVIEGVTGSIVVTDVLPTGLVFEALVAIVADPNISYNGPGTAVEAPAGTITVDLGDVTNTADANNANDFLIIRLRARVADIPGNAQGVTRTNSGSLTSDVGPAGPDTQDITVVEPNLVIDKVPSDANPSLGDTVVFTVTVRHQGSFADAFDVVLTDAIPARLTYVTGSTMGQATVDETDPDQPVFDLGTITLAEMQKTFTFECRVDLDATVGEDIDNVIDGVYDSQAGTPAVERGDTAQGTGTVTPGQPAFIDAVKTVAIAVDGGAPGVVDPGDTLEYTITLVNNGPAVTNAVFSDRVPANTTYVAASLSSSVGGEDDSGAPDLLVAVGAMATNDIVTITFRVTVDAGTPAGTVISNQGSVDSDQTVPEPTDADGVDANGDQPTDIPVGGPPPVQNGLYATKVVEWLIDADATGDVTPLDTLRYTIVLTNVGDGTLNNVTLADTIPAGLTYVAASASVTGAGATVNVVGQSVSASIPSIAPLGFETVTFDVIIDVPLINLDGNPLTEPFTNQGTVDSDETAPSRTDGNLDPSDGNQPTTIIATDDENPTPSVDVEKRWSLAVDADGDGLVDPGDTIEYSIVVLNGGPAVAENARLADIIPADTTAVAGSAQTSFGVIVTEDPLEVNLGDVNPGEVVVITFRVTVDGGTPDGTIIPNQATVTGDNFAPEPSDDNGDDSDGKNPTLTPVDTGGGSGAGSPGGLSKTLFAASEADSVSPEVLIGEVLTFRVTIEVPAGLLREAAIVDTLPAGLTYLPGTARLQRIFDTGLTASQNPGGVNSAASGAFIALADGSDLTVAGQVLTLFLGDLINSDNDGNAESYTLEFQAVVANIAGNDAGDTLTNSATLTFLDGLNQPQSLTPATAAVTVLEPNLVVSKTPNPPGLLTLGGSLQFTVTVTNPDGGFTGHGYDVVLTDVLPAEYTSLTVDSVTPAMGVSGVTDNSAGTTLSVSAAVFPPDGVLTIVYTVTAPGPLTPGTIANTADAVATSLPGTNGTGSATPGAPGDADGERTGSGLGPNDLSASDTANTPVGELAVTKSILNPQTRYAIGDIVEYQVVISLPPEPDLSGVAFTDILDEGLTYVTGSLAVNADAGVTFGASPADFSRADNTPAAGQETLTLAWNTLANSSAMVQTITLTYNVLVDNILSNQDNQTLANDAGLGFDNPAGGGAQRTADSETVTVGEPNLTLVHSILTPTANLQAGDTITYQVVVGNNGTTTAFETVLSNILPAGLENVAGLMVTATAGGAETPTFTNNGTDWNTSGFDIPVGGSVTIEFTVTLANSVIPGQQIQNSVDATFTSRDGADANERDGSTPNSNQGNDADLNNYNETANAPTITVDDPVQLDKRFHPDPADTTYTIGEIATYRLTIALLEGTVDDLVVTDTLPAGVTFIDATVSNGNLGITQGFTPPPMQVGQVLTFDFGQVVNPANGDSGDDFITIDIRVRIDDIVTNVDGTVLGNNAQLGFTGAGGPQTRDFDADAGTPGVQPLDLTIVEPDVTITKTPSRANVSQGDTVTFSILLDHTVLSAADAFDLEIVDTLPAGLTYVPGSASLPVSVAGQQLTFNVASLTLLDDNLTITYQARVDLDATIGATLTNSVDLTYSTLPGADPNERTYPDSDSADITVAASTFIDAVKTAVIAVDGATPGVLDPGDTVEYTIVLLNNGADATNVVFTDTVPSETTYVPGTLTTSAGTVDDSGAPDLAVDVGGMLDGASVTITFRVTVNAGTPAGTQIANQGLVDSDQTVPEPSDADGVDANGDQPTIVTVGGPPALANALYVQKTVELLTDADASGDISPGDVMRYRFIFRNRGETTLTNVVLNDVLPAGVTYVPASETISAGMITVTAPNVAAAIPSIAVKGFENASVDVTVDGPPLFDSDANPTSETFVNQGGVDSDQTDPGFTDSNGDPSDGAQPTEFTAVDGVAGAPALDVEKRWRLAIDADGDGLVDPGDTLAYTITLENLGSAAAIDVRLADTIPADTAVVAGSAATSQGVVVSEDPLDVNIGDIGPGGFVTVSFRVTVNAGTPDGTIIPNQATASGDNFADEPSDDNGNDADGKNPTLTPVDTGGGANAGAPGGLAKTIVAASEADSADPDVLIGEVVTFQLSVALPAGLTREARLLDTLPAGLQYLAGTAELARVFDTGLNASLDPGGVNAAPSGVFVPLADGSELVIAGQSLSLLLGDVLNSDNDGNEERYLLRFQALVLNTAGNQAGATLTNSGGFAYLDGLGQPRNLTPVTAAVDVNEANLQVLKTADPALLLPSGGDVAFTIVVSNPDTGFTGPAYEVNILDALSAEWTGLVVDSLTPGGGVTGVVDNSAGTTLDIDVAFFPPGGTLTIRITATAAGPLALGTLTNTSVAGWTSLPGTNGTGAAAPGAPGDSDGERTDAGGVNDLTASGSANVVVGQPALTKTILNPQTRYAIGDLVTYQVTIDLPPGVLPAAVFSDVLDEGLTYVAGSLVIDIPNNVATGNVVGEFTRADNTPAAGQETLTLDFDGFANGTGAVATVTLTYQALVDNILSNQNNQSLANAAALDFDDPGGGPPVQIGDGQTALVGEPNLALVKSALTAVAGLDAGDTVDFQVTVENNGTTAAFETVLSDTLPAGLENITGLIVTAVTGGAETPILTNNGTDWSSSPFDLPVGATVTITFTAQLANSVIPGQQIQNTVDATYTSRDGADPNERDGSDPGSNQGDDSQLNNYNVSASAPTITVADPVALDKRFQPDPADSDYTVGQVVGYRLTVSLIEGTLDDLVVTDVLPAGLRFESATVGLGNLGISTQYTPPPQQAGQTLTFDLGQVVNPANGATDDDFITIDILATVENVPANVDGAILGNNASLSFTGPTGTETRDFDADLGTPGVQPLELTVVEPDLETLKSVDNPTPAPGQTVTFTLRVQHSVASNADAYDLVVSDTLPAGLTYVLGSASLAPVINGAELIWDIPSLTLLDGFVEITYQATVDADVVLGVPLLNLAFATYTTLPGVNPDERTGADGPGGLNDLVTNQAQAAVTPTAPDLDATKAAALQIDADGDGLASPGDTLRFTVVLTNSGNAAATGVVYSDTPDANTTLTVGSVSVSQGTVTQGNTAGDAAVAVDVGTLAGGAMATIVYDVVVNSPLPQGVTQVSNQGVFASNELPDVPTDDPDTPDPDDPTDTPVFAEPLLVVEKIDSLAVDADGNGFPSPGDTLEYQIVIRNDGGADASAVVFSDIPDPNAPLVAGTVTTTRGTVSLGNAGGDVAVQVDIGTIAGGGDSVTITFQVQIVNPVPAGVNRVANQAIVSSPDKTAVLSDDPDTPDPGDPTETPILTEPELSAFKTDALLVDADGDGSPSPGDTLRYQVEILNQGNAAAMNVAFSDIPDANTSLVAGSVTASQGTVTGGNAGAPPVTVDLGTLAAGASATVTFDATINDPLPAGVVRVANQGVVSSDDEPDVPTDDPDTPDPDDPTATPVVAAPLLSAAKQDALYTDNDGDGQPSPGDTLLYQVVIANSGNADAANVVFQDTPDANTTLAAGSIAVSQGVVTGGQNGAPPVIAELGTIPAGGSATVSFFVTINTPLPFGVTRVRNQGVVSSDDTPSIPTDDPDTPNPDDPTDTPVAAAPVLSAAKTDILLIDADGDGQPSPGDTLLYQVAIVNSGNGAATGVTFSDTPDPNTALVAGSVMTSQGTVTGGNAGAPPVTVDIGAIPGAGGSVTISFEVTINDPLPAGVTQLANQGVVSSNETPDQPTDDPDTPDPDDPTVTPVGGEPALSASKRDTLLIDADGNGQPSPGDTLLYQVVIANSGNAGAANVVFQDTPGQYTTLVPGSVQTSQGALGVSPPPVSVNLGDLPAGGSATVSFQVVIDNPLPAGVTQVSNQGLVSSDDTPSIPTDDPDTGEPDDPTDTPVVSAPALDATKAAALAVDADGDGLPSPGDTLAYVITIVNSGNAAATGVSYSDTPDANTALVAGSVVVSQGQVTGGNFGAPPVTADLGVIPAGASATLSYQVVIDNPLPAGVTQLVNQGVVGSNELPDVPTDDPGTVAPDDPTVVVVEAEPLLDATKADFLLLDNDGDGLPSPGDTLRYVVEIVNTGNAAATGVVYTDTPDPNTSLVPGSVQTSVGTVTGGNNGTPPIVVDIGTLAPGATAVISYDVVIDNPLPANVVQLSNQGVTGSNELPDVPTDDPDTSDPDDPTLVDVGGAPQLASVKVDSLAVDADNDGFPSPGDTLEYSVQITNIGTRTADNVVLTDTPDANTTLIVGSVSTTQGAAVLGNNPGDVSVRVDIGALAPQQTVTVVFRVTIADPLPAGVTRVANQAVISGDGAPTVVSDDPDTPDPDDPTVTVVVAAPDLTVDKRDSLAVDADGDGAPSPGDTLEYEVVIVNRGNAAATGVVFNDTPDANTALVAGSVTASQGTVTGGNAGAPPVVVDIGALAAGAAVTVRFQVVIADPVPAGVTFVRNQGVVSSNELPDLPSDDPDTPDPDDPTDTPLGLTPELTVSKRDSLAVDADGDGQPSPGDTLLYTVRVANVGAAPATGVVFQDTPDANTTLAIGSVQTTVGVVTGGNAGTPPIVVAIGTLDPGQEALISFLVVIVDPLPPGVTQVANQGVVASNELPDAPSDDPDTGAPDDPTVTVVAVRPILTATKTDALFDDADGDGLPSPGDTLSYLVRVANIGNAVADNVVFTDTPDPNTSLVAGSVQTSLGTVTGGNAGVPPVTVDIGALPAGAEALIGFRVTINDPLPDGVRFVRNQGLVSSDNATSVLTDDPDVPGDQDPTDTPVVTTGGPGAPVLSATKTDSLLVDLNGDGFAGPGDTLRYQVVIANSGTAPAVNVVFTDTPDPNTSLVAGSVLASQGAVTGGNAGVPPVSVDIGALPAGASVTVSFSVTVNDPFPAGVAQVSNQGVVSSDGGSVVTDDPDTGAPDDPTDTPIVTGAPEPLLRAEKTDALFLDADGDGQVSAGDELEYLVTIANLGAAPASGVVFTDTPDANTTLVAGSVQTSLGTVTGGNAGVPPVTVSVGFIDPGQVATISFRVTINDPLPMGVTFVRNQGVVSSNELPDVLTDDPDLGGPDDPTDTPIGGDPFLVATKVDSLFVDANGDGAASPGDTILYQIDIRNIGAATATGVIFTDTPDANTTIVPGSVLASQGVVLAGDDGAPPIVVAIGEIQGRGGSASVSFQVVAASPLSTAVSQVVNQGVVSSQEVPDVLTDDPDVGGSDDPTGTPIVQADLRVVKTGPASVAAGATFDYLIEIANLGPDPATNVVMTDPLPPELAFVAASSTQGACAYDGVSRVVSCQIGGLTVAQTETVTLTVRVLREGQIVNQAQVTADQVDPDPDNNDDATVVTGTPGIDLELTKTVDEPNPDFNDVITYSLALRNRGPSDATGVVVTDLLPPELVFISATASTGSYDAGTGLWTVGGVAAGLVETLQIQARVQGIGTIVNTAEVTAADQPDVDSTPGNGDPLEDDQGSATIQVDTLVELVLVKTVAPEVVAQGGMVSFTIDVVNQGPSPAIEVEVDDVLPMGLTFAGAGASQGAYDPATGVWTIGDLAVGQVVTLTIDAIVTGELVGQPIVNTATVRSPLPEIDFDNNVDSAVFRVIAPVPTLTEWGLILFVGSLAMAALYLMRRRRLAE